MKKRRSKAGETLVETLVSVLIAALAFALLSTAAVTAARINAAARELFATQSNLSTAIKDLEQELGVTAEGTHFGTSQKTGSEEVTLYTTDNGYQYYTDTTSSGVTP